MTIGGSQSSDRQGTIRLIRGCPCFKVFGDEKLCVNDDSVLEVDVIDVDTSLFGLARSKEDMDEERSDEDSICYASVYIDEITNRVYCISQGWVLRIHGRDVPASDIEDALQFMSTKDLTASMEICSDCLYKFILTLSDTFADTMTKQEKADEIKRYVDKFSLMIAVKHSDMDDMMKSIGSEDDIEEGVDSFAFLRSYLVQLLEQQDYWSKIHHELNNEKADDWLIKLAQMRELLARLEFQFYSQTLQLRDIADFNLLIKMLQFILKTSDEILLLNERIHTEIRSTRFVDLVKDDERFKHLEAYGEKSRTVEHNFSNILQILSRL